MTDYTKLVAALQNNDWSDACPCCDEAMCKDADCIILQAAAAIEELQQIADHHEQTAKDYWKEACEYKAQLPKRGEIVRCGECKWYDPLDRTRPFFCPVMDCETGVMEDDFCSRGERKAKMEVQE